jgi:hypothetical protein
VIIHTEYTEGPLNDRTAHGQVADNYDQQAARPPFRSIAEFLSWGDLKRYTSVSIEQFFRERGVALGLYPTVTSQYNSTTLYQVALSYSVIFRK